MKIELDLCSEEIIELKLALEEKLNALENRMVCSDNISNSYSLKLKKRYETCEKLYSQIVGKIKEAQNDIYDNE